MPKILEQTRRDSLHFLIQDAFRKEIEEICFQEVEEAQKRVEEKIRGLTGSVVTKVFSWIDFEYDRDRLQITVKFPEKDK